MAACQHPRWVPWTEHGWPRLEPCNLERNFFFFNGGFWIFFLLSWPPFPSLVLQKGCRSCHLPQRADSWSESRSWVYSKLFLHEFIYPANKYLLNTHYVSGRHFSTSWSFSLRSDEDCIHLLGLLEQTRWLKWQKCINIVSVQGAGSLRLGCCQVWILPSLILFCASHLASGGFLMIFGGFWLVNLTLISAFIFTWHSPCMHVFSKFPLFIRLPLILN